VYTWNSQFLDVYQQCSMGRTFVLGYLFDCRFCA